MQEPVLFEAFWMNFANCGSPQGCVFEAELLRQLKASKRGVVGGAEFEIVLPPTVLLTVTFPPHVIDSFENRQPIGI